MTKKRKLIIPATIIPAIACPMITEAIKKIAKHVYIPPKNIKFIVPADVPKHRDNNRSE